LPQGGVHVSKVYRESSSLRALLIRTSRAPSARNCVPT